MLHSIPVGDLPSQETKSLVLFAAMYLCSDGLPLCRKTFTAPRANTLVKRLGGFESFEGIFCTRSTLSIQTSCVVACIIPSILYQEVLLGLRSTAPIQKGHLIGRGHMLDPTQVNMERMVMR